MRLIVQSSPGGRSDVAAAAPGTQGLPFQCGCILCPSLLTMIGWAWLFWADRATRKWGLAEYRTGRLRISFARERCEQWPFEKKVIPLSVSIFSNGSPSPSF